jgi:hypothetical protein
MNIKKKIEQYLQAAPKPPAPDDLLDRLQENAAVTNVKPYTSFARRFFAPTGRSISFRRVAAAAAIAFVILLPLSYGAAKAIKHFRAFVLTFEYPEDDITYTVSSRTEGKSEEDAKKTLEEFGRLYREGKAKEVKPGVWQVTLSNGEKFNYGGRHPELAGLMHTEEAKQVIKKEFDEIQKLRKAGKYKRVFIKELKENGVRVRIYEDSFTLSNGEVIKTSTSEPVKDEDGN